MVVYPATSLHQVTPITRGARLACFFWVQSLVRDDAQRTMLFDLDNAIQRLNQTGADARRGAAWSAAITTSAPMERHLISKARRGSPRLAAQDPWLDRLVGSRAGPVVRLQRHLAEPSRGAAVAAGGAAQQCPVEAGESASGHDARHGDVGAMLAGTARPDHHVRVEKSRPVPWAEAPASAVAMQPEHWIFNFNTPKSQIQADYWVGNRTVGVRRTDAGVVATLANLHKGVGMPVAWILLVDTLAGSMILLSLSGLALVAADAAQAHGGPGDPGHRARGHGRPGIAHL